MYGRPVVFKKTADTLTTLSYIDRVNADHIKMEWPFLSVAAVIGGLMVTLSAFTVAFGWRLKPRLLAALRFGLVLIFSLFIGLLFAGIAGLSALGAVAGFVAGTASAIAAGYVFAAIAGRFIHPASLAHKALPVLGCMVAAALIILIDALTGAHLLSTSISSYPFVGGFRFYGIGNEYMGVLIGAVYTSAVWLGVRNQKPEPSGGWFAVILLMIFAVSTFILGWPGFGANAGGAIAAIVAFGLVYRAIFRGVFRIREAIGLTVVAVAVVFALAYVDLLVNRGASSHIGYTAGIADHQGWMELVRTVSRKISMNLRLIATEQSKTAIIGFVPFFALWAFYIRQKVGNLAGSYPRLGPCLRGGMAGAVVAFLFNDSGIIAGSIIVASLVCCLLYSLLQEVSYNAADNGS
jgi:hypothetical protein